jgi:hypothetical protein
MEENKIKVGVWMHYKGGVYKVIGYIINATDDSNMVVYANTDGLQFVRTQEDFLSTVEVEGKEEKRFTYLGKESL